MNIMRNVTGKDSFGKLNYCDQLFGKNNVPNGGRYTSFSMSPSANKLICGWAEVNKFEIRVIE